MLELLKNTVDEGNLDTKEKNKMRNELVLSLIEERTFDKTVCYRQDTHDDVLDVPLTLDDSIIDELELELKDPLLYYKFSIPDKYVVRTERRHPTMKASSKKIKTLKDNVVEVVSYTNVKTRIFPDGYRVDYHENGDIKLTEIGGRTIYYNQAHKSINVTDKKAGFKAEIMNNGMFAKEFDNGMKFIRFANGNAKLTRRTKDELTKMLDGKYRKKSRFGKISLI